MPFFLYKFGLNNLILLNFLSFLVINYKILCQASTDLKLLHEKLDRTKKVEKTNEQVKEEFLETFSGSISELLEGLNTFRLGL